MNTREFLDSLSHKDYVDVLNYLWETHEIDIELEGVLTLEDE